MKYKIKKHIIERGYPIGSPKYEIRHATTYPLTDKNFLECHAEASKKEKKKFGTRKFHSLTRLIHSYRNELLGDNSITGKIYISSIVPEYPLWKRNEVAYHEQQEATCLKKKRMSIFKNK